MKIYTKTGDKGQTSTFTGKRRSKADPVICALGDIDECNAHVGLAIAHAANQDRLKLERIQHWLFRIGACVATPLSEAKNKNTAFDPAPIALLEQWIDAMDVELAPLKAFILPGGCPLSCQIHVIRAVVRRAERSVVLLLEANSVEENVLIFLNRLSDYFFTLSRFVNAKNNVVEPLWNKELL